MPQSKTQTGSLNKKSKHIGTLYPDPSHKQGHTKTQRIGGRLTNQMESENNNNNNNNKKKTGVVTFVSDKIDFNSNKD